jgi:hypothetical protein
LDQSTELLATAGAFFAWQASSNAPNSNLLKTNELKVELGWRADHLKGCNLKSSQYDLKADHIELLAASMIH